MPKLTKFLIPLVIVATVALAGCTDEKPTASEWSAKFIELCTKDSSESDAYFEKLTSSGATPTIEQMMVAFTEFAPIFEASIARYKALDRPSGLDTEINELFAALHGAANAIRKVGSDRSAAELAMAGEFGPEFLRLETAASAVGLEECN